MAFKLIIACLSLAAITLVTVTDGKKTKKENGMEVMKRQDCGQVKLSRGGGRQGRILGGNNAYFGEFPWQVTIFTSHKDFTNGKIRCGGSLISDQWVITAAHCMTVLASDIYVVLGEYDLLSTKERLKRVVRGVIKTKRHPLYDYANFKNDIGLLKLDRPVTFQNHIQPICLPSINPDHLPGKYLYATGFGKYFEGGKLATILQKVALPVIKNSDCERMYARLNKTLIFGDDFICAGYKNGKRDTCHGDSGGPLIFRAPDGHWELQGITSHGYGCGRRLRPGIYVRVENVRKWISNIISES